ncbi:MAG: NADP-dependent malic enzyme [Deltaproteobacteria bacterium]|nr:NADP-dependent malic enzyme [Deltaproteobacteria bacterium]
MGIYEDSLEYHSRGRPGKIEVNPCKPTATQRDLSLAYSPGVAGPCLAIAADPLAVYKYTTKGNLVAVVTNGTAVLGLGNIGPLAAKPVMEGKGMLFKKFADIDVFDIELNAADPEDVIRACKYIEPTVGAINLEDIKAPECFYIEERLRAELRIPVFHDDQHGTAIICGAAFLNALEITHKKIDKVKCVFIGAGAACIASANMFLNLGVKPENLMMTDIDGVLFKGRTVGMNPYKERFARETPHRTLADAIKGADVVVGLSAKGVLTQDMIKSMAKDPMVFAMANPEPEILPEEVHAVRKDAIMATGRSDYPNQVNNVLGYPFIFRGALDVSATQINEAMKMAAVRALAQLAKEEVPESVSRAYGNKTFKFGRDYLIPKPFDHRALLAVSPAVAKAAIDSGVAQKKIDVDEYRGSLEQLLGGAFTVMRSIKNRVKKGTEHSPGGRLKSIVFPEGDHPKILKACARLIEDGIAEPILLGRREKIVHTIASLELEQMLAGVQIIDPLTSPKIDEYAQRWAEARQRKGMTPRLASELLRQRSYYGCMMVQAGEADGVLNGISRGYPEAIRPALQIVGVRPGSKLAGIYMMIFKKRVLFFADTTVNIDPKAEDLADIAIYTADLSQQFVDQKPRVAMLSFSNFGSSSHPFAAKVARAVDLARAKRPDLEIDGEMQADTALVPEILTENYPFSSLKDVANILIFPDLQSGNIAYKLMMRLGGAEAIGPILVGMQKPVNVLQQNSDVEDVVNMAAITVIEAQQGMGEKSRPPEHKPDHKKEKKS